MFGKIFLLKTVSLEERQTGMSLSLTVPFTGVSPTNLVHLAQINNVKVQVHALEDFEWKLSSVKAMKKYTTQE